MKPRTFAILAAVVVTFIGCNPGPFVLTELGYLTAEQCQAISYRQGQFLFYGIVASFIGWFVLKQNRKKPPAVDDP